MAMCGVGIDFPTKETSVGSWFGFAGGMCTTAQYFEVDGVILDLSNSYWGGWIALMVLQVKSHYILTKLPGCDTQKNFGLILSNSSFDLKGVI